MQDRLLLKMDPKDINFFNRVMEGYEYFGIVSTLDRKEGIVVVRTTPDMIEEARAVVDHLPIDCAYLR